MTSELRRLYMLSVLEALTTYAAGGGELHFATLSDGGKLAITFTLEDGDAYNRQLTALFNERVEAQHAIAPASLDGQY